mmetsp:Transcript_16649/g.41186  ORF Transcript_16649/g.41186 Transcript_16649/m.41186 type:complete len:237 (+) Transcript_16649:1343-2053(+)
MDYARDSADRDAVLCARVQHLFRDRVVPPLHDPRDHERRVCLHRRHPVRQDAPDRALAEEDGGGLLRGQRLHLHLGRGRGEHPVADGFFPLPAAGPDGAAVLGGHETAVQRRFQGVLLREGENPLYRGRVLDAEPPRAGDGALRESGGALRGVFRERVQTGVQDKRFRGPHPRAWRRHRQIRLPDRDGSFLPRIPAHLRVLNGRRVRGHHEATVGDVVAGRPTAAHKSSDDAWGTH